MIACHKHIVCKENVLKVHQLWTCELMKTGKCKYLGWMDSDSSYIFQVSSLLFNNLVTLHTCGVKSEGFAVRVQINVVNFPPAGNLCSNFGWVSTRLVHNKSTVLETLHALAITLQVAIWVNCLLCCCVNAFLVHHWAHACTCIIWSLSFPPACPQRSCSPCTQCDPSSSLLKPTILGISFEHANNNKFVVTINWEQPPCKTIYYKVNQCCFLLPKLLAPS